MILWDLRYQRNDEVLLLEINAFVGFRISEVEWRSLGYLYGLCLSWCFLWKVNVLGWLGFQRQE